MATNTPNNIYRFQGFQFPTTTPVPDEVFDLLMYHITGNDLKVLLYICRRTFGFKKDSDNISLNQMLHGIVTKNGKVLDRGTGLSKPTLLRSVKSLEEKGIIVRSRRQSAEKGYEATNYRLNILDPLGQKMNLGLSQNFTKPLVKELDIQQTVLQETVEQQNDVVVEQTLKKSKLLKPLEGQDKGSRTAQTDILQHKEIEQPDAVGQALQKFGISKPAATQLGKKYPEAHILDKLELAQWLVSMGSPLVAKNPAGWLRKAIEEDYALPRNYESSRHRQAKEAKGEKIARGEAKQRQMAEAEYRRAKTEAKTYLLEQYPPQPIGEEGLTTESVWNLTLKELKEKTPEITQASYETFLKDTILLKVTDRAAQIAVPSAFAVAWLERKLYPQIVNALKDVLKRQLDLQFITTSPDPE